MPLRRVVVLVLLLPVVQTSAGVTVPAQALAAVPAAPPVVRLAADVAVRLGTDDARLAVGIWMNPGEFREAVNEDGTPVDANLSHAFRIIRSGSVSATGRATLQSLLGKECRFAAQFTAHKPLDAKGFGYLLSLNGESHIGKAWTADDGQDKFPQQIGNPVLKKGSTQTFTLESGGHVWTLAFPAAVDYVVQDRRSRGGEDFEVSFVSKSGLKLAVKTSGSATCTVTTAAGTVRAESRPPLRLVSDTDWSILDSSADIKQGSALDFSRFARKPVQGRQYGVRLTGRQTLPTLEEASLVARQLVRAGQTSVELADFSSQLLAADAPVMRNRDALLAFDGFVKTLKKEGLSVLCDFQPSRSYDWQQLGVTAPDGRQKNPVDARLASALCAFSEKAFVEWEMPVSAFYSHKPLKSTRSFGQDKVLSGVCLGGGVFGSWRDLVVIPEVVTAYSDWLTAKRKDNPDFMKDSVCEPMDLRLFSLGEKRCESVRRFLLERETELMVKRARILDGLKVEAKKVSVPGALDYRDVASERGTEGDVVATTFSIGSQWPLGEHGRYPHAVANVNPFRSGEPLSDSLSWHRAEGHGLGIVSWSAPGCSAWRSGIGLYVGANAAKESWSLLFRSGASDPTMQLFERAIMPLYLRGDYAAGDPMSMMTFADGGFVVSTPRTCGGFSPLPNGTISAGCLEAKLGAAPATIWVSSLSERPITKSRRLLLTHVTDIQRNGSVFADSRRKLLLSAPGTGGFLMRNGTAAVRIGGLEKPSTFHVVPLKADGTRQKSLKTRLEEGGLCFDIAVGGATGAQTSYEIFKD